ncbi:MAG: ADOP family duplicated permease [Gemmatimonadota bacterium]
MAWLLSGREADLALADLEELHRAWADALGREEADRRYLRQLRQYPIRLLAQRLGRLLRPPAPRPPDLRQALRSLVRAPGLSAAILLTLGIGIGGCTAIFAIVDVLYLRALPYPEQDRVFWIYTDAPPNRWPFSVVDFEALSRGRTSFGEIAAYTRGSATLVDARGAERIPTLRVTPGFFELLGVTPRSGRAPSPADAEAAAPATALVTLDFAGRRLGATRPNGSDAIGHTLRLDGELVEVAGVVPSDTGPLTSGVAVFPTLRLEPPARKGPFFLAVLGRLDEATEAGTAAAELRRLNDDLFPLWVDSYQDDRATWGMMSLPELLQGNVDRLLLVLMGAVALLLLIAATNATNLLLSRVIGRRQELAVRAALGASRGRILAHLFVESGILALGGVLVGLLVAQAAIAIMPTVADAYIPRLDEVSLSGPTLLLALALSAGCALLFGLVPLMRPSSHSGLEPTLRSGGRGASHGRADQRTQRLLVVSQLAVAVPLLVGAALLLSSFARLGRMDPGFEPEGLLSLRVGLPLATYPDPEGRKQFWDPLVDRVAALPGVLSVGLANARPGQVFQDSNNFDLEDRPTPPGQSQPSVPWIIAEHGFFETLRIPLVEGRWFDPADDLGAEPVVLVDRAWARRFFPDGSAVGRRMRSGGQTTGPWITVVGVVGDVPYSEAGQEGQGAVYMPDPRRGSTAPFLYVRTSGDPGGLVARIRTEIRRADPGLPLTDVASGEAVLHASLTRPRHLTTLLTAFAAVALALAVVGLYGVLAQTVQRRRPDIAIRLALGGSPRAVLSLVLGQGMTLVGVGIAAGLVVALALTRVLEGLLYEVSPRDPLILVGVTGLMLAVSAMACLLPGRRAVRVDPIEALRED